MKEIIFQKTIMRKMYRVVKTNGGYSLLHFHEVVGLEQIKNGELEYKIQVLLPKYTADKNKLVVIINTVNYIKDDTTEKSYIKASDEMYERILKKAVGSALDYWPN